MLSFTTSSRSVAPAELLPRCLETAESVSDLSLTRHARRTTTCLGTTLVSGCAGCSPTGVPLLCLFGLSTRRGSLLRGRAFGQSAHRLGLVLPTTTFFLPTDCSADSLLLRTLPSEMGALHVSSLLGGPLLFIRRRLSSCLRTTRFNLFLSTLVLTLDDPTTTNHVEDYACLLSTVRTALQILLLALTLIGTAVAISRLPRAALGLQRPDLLFYLRRLLTPLELGAVLRLLQFVSPLLSTNLCVVLNALCLTSYYRLCLGANDGDGSRSATTTSTYLR